MEQRIEGVVSSGIDRTVIARRGVFRRSCGAAVRVFLAHQPRRCPVFRIAGRQVRTREGSVVLQESIYVAAGGVEVVSAIRGSGVEFPIIWCIC